MKRQWKQIAISFVLPVFILLIIYAAWGQYPFGDKTLLIWDMDSQYAPFFSHLHDILHGDASALYTFSRALGGNMLSVAAYYLISPFNLVFYFFGYEDIYIGILIVALLKTGSMGSAMYWFLNRRNKDVYAFIFSTAYALSAYVAGYQFNIFWMDALILLPFVCGGIEALVDENRHMLYVCSLALSIITNFYTGYMICIFSLLYFFCYFLFISNKEYRFKTLLRYALGSLMGGMLSMFIALPTLEIMQDGKSGFSLHTLKDFSSMFKYRELFDAFFCATISSKQITSGRPLIYCGVFAVIMAFCWFILGKESLKEKLAYFFMLAVIVISFHHYNLNCIWHAFNRPSGSPYRFSFIYIFLLLYIAYKGCISLRERGYASKYDKRVICGIGLLLCLGLFCRIGAFREKHGIAILILNIFLAAVYAVLSLSFKNKLLGFAAVLILTCAELFVNADSLYASSSQYETVKVSEYKAYLHKMQPLIDEAKADAESGEGIYRTEIERSAQRTSNDPFLFGIYGLTSYTSVEKQNVIQIAGRLGYSNNINWGMHYNNGSTKAGDAFLGVKYIISMPEQENGEQMPEGGGEYVLYENEDVLPFAFFADASIFDTLSEDNTFRYTDELYHCLDSGRDENIFEGLTGNLLQAYRCEKLDDGGWKALDGEKEAYLEYEYTTDEDLTVYTRYDKAGASWAKAFIDDKEIDLSLQRSDVKHIASLSGGDKLRLRFYLTEEGILSPDKLYVYGEREAVLKEYASDINAQQVRVTMEKGDRINISCTNDGDGIKYLLCTIPYDKGWRVSMDKAAAVRALRAQDFIVIPVETGEHEIELSFVPPGFYAGIGISLFAIFFIAAWANLRQILNLFCKNDILKG